MNPFFVKENTFLLKLRPQQSTALPGETPDGSVFSVGSADGGEVSLAAVYDRGGKLTGAEIAED